MAVREGGGEGNPPKFLLLFHKALPWKPCMKHHLKSYLIFIFQGGICKHIGSSTNTHTHTHHVWVHGSSCRYMAGILEGQLIQEDVHWHNQGWSVPLLQETKIQATIWVLLTFTDCRPRGNWLPVAPFSASTSPHSWLHPGHALPGPSHSNCLAAIDQPGRKWGQCSIHRIQAQEGSKPAAH